ncbi:UNVERIFIED_CONTAM: hypothetical protein FKN15_046261 [Acipenser sinensis]
MKTNSAKAPTYPNDSRGEGPSFLMDKSGLEPQSYSDVYCGFTKDLPLYDSKVSPNDASLFDLDTYSDPSYWTQYGAGVKSLDPNQSYQEPDFLNHAYQMLLPVGQSVMQREYNSPPSVGQPSSGSGQGCGYAGEQDYSHCRMIFKQEDHQSWNDYLSPEHCHPQADYATAAPMAQHCHRVAKHETTGFPAQRHSPESRAMGMTAYTVSPNDASLFDLDTYSDPSYWTQYGAGVKSLDPNQSYQEPDFLNHAYQMLLPVGQSVMQREYNSPPSVGQPSSGSGQGCGYAGEQDYSHCRMIFKQEDHQSWNDYLSPEHCHPQADYATAAPMAQHCHRVAKHETTGFPAQRHSPESRAMGMTAYTGVKSLDPNQSYQEPDFLNHAYQMLLPVGQSVMQREYNSPPSVGQPSSGSGQGCGYAGEQDYSHCRMIFKQEDHQSWNDYLSPEHCHPQADYATAAPMAQHCHRVAKHETTGFPAQRHSPESRAMGMTAYTGSGPIHLWQYLLELLLDESCQPFISWTGDGWEFKLSDPSEADYATAAPMAQHCHRVAKHETTGFPAQRHSPESRAMGMTAYTGKEHVSYTDPYSRKHGVVLFGSGPIHLWQYLLELLLDESCQPFISWTGDGWEFKLSDPSEVAKRWGKCKNKPKMNYEKMSRGMRYYYHKNIIHKTGGKRYVYRFVCDVQSMLAPSAGRTLFVHMDVITKGQQGIFRFCKPGAAKAGSSSPGLCSSPVECDRESGRWFLRKCVPVRNQLRRAVGDALLSNQLSGRLVLS